MLPRHPAHQIGRYLGGVRKRFPEDPGEFWDHLPGISRRDVEFRVLRPEMPRYLPGVDRLVVGCVVHPDRKTSDFLL